MDTSPKKVTGDGSSDTLIALVNLDLLQIAVCQKNRPLSLLLSLCHGHSTVIYSGTSL